MPPAECGVQLQLQYFGGRLGQCLPASACLPAYTDVGTLLACVLGICLAHRIIATCALRKRPCLQVSGQPLNAHFFGKPHAAPYRLAEELLLAQAAALGLVPPTAEAALPGLDSGAELAAQTSTAALDGIPWPFGAIYAVGDNPAADVRGANAAGSPWVSVLVTKTGVARQNCAVDCAQASCKVRAAM